MKIIRQSELAETPDLEYFQAMRRLALSQGGFFYPWRSRLERGNGEDAYTEMLHAHLDPKLDALEAGCGHGTDAILIAPRVRSLVAFDAVREFIDIAQRSADERGLRNLELVTGDSSPKRSGRIPADSNSIDLIVSRRGPTSFILDARRVARPGAVLLQLNPLTIPAPEWNDELPDALRMQPPQERIPASVEERLARAEIPLHSCWTYDVPEWFNEPDQLHLFLTWQRDPASVPPFEACRAALERLFARHASSEGIATRHRRYLWKAVIE